MERPFTFFSRHGITRCAPPYAARVQLGDELVVRSRRGGGAAITAFILGATCITLGLILLATERRPHFSLTEFWVVLCLVGVIPLIVMAFLCRRVEVMRLNPSTGRMSIVAHRVFGADEFHGDTSSMRIRLHTAIRSSRGRGMRPPWEGFALCLWYKDERRLEDEFVMALAVRKTRAECMQVLAAANGLLDPFCRGNGPQLIVHT